MFVFKILKNILQQFQHSRLKITGNINHRQGGGGWQAHERFSFSFQVISLEIIETIGHPWGTDRIRFSYQGLHLGTIENTATIGHQREKGSGIHRISHHVTETMDSVLDFSNHSNCRMNLEHNGSKNIELVHDQFLHCIVPTRSKHWRKRATTQVEIEASIAATTITSNEIKDVIVEPCRNLWFFQLLFKYF